MANNLINSDELDDTRNLLEITDEEVAANWKFGMVRSAARLVAERGGPYSVSGYYGVPAPDSDYAHVRGNVFWGEPVAPCALVSVSRIREDGETYAEFDTFDSNKETSETRLTGLGKCACGRFEGEVYYAISLGELIYFLATVE